MPSRLTELERLPNQWPKIPKSTDAMLVAPCKQNSGIFTAKSALSHERKALNKLPRYFIRYTFLLLTWILTSKCLSRNWPGASPLTSDLWPLTRQTNPTWPYATCPLMGAFSIVCRLLFLYISLLFVHNSSACIYFLHLLFIPAVFLFIFYSRTLIWTTHNLVVHVQ